MLLSTFTASTSAALDLRPEYHFTRLANEMNDPNGLMWLPGPPSASGAPAYSYHMFFQSTDPGQSAGSIWGHAMSPDLVRWRRMNRSGVRGSTGGGVALDRESGPARAAIVASVPIFPPRVPAVGLSVWLSNDENLTTWSALENGTCAGTTSPTSGMICPKMVRDQERTRSTKRAQPSPLSRPTYIQPTLTGPRRTPRRVHWRQLRVEGRCGERSDDVLRPLGKQRVPDWCGGVVRLRRPERDAASAALLLS